MVPEIVMSQPTVFVRHKTLPGRRDDVRAAWERHLQAAIAANPGFISYYYGYVNGDPDSICAFQQYASDDAADAFLKSDGFKAYLRDVQGLLAGPAEVTAMTVQWTKKQ